MRQGWGLSPSIGMWGSTASRLRSVGLLALVALPVAWMGLLGRPAQARPLAHREAAAALTALEKRSKQVPGVKRSAAGGKQLRLPQRAPRHLPGRPAGKLVGKGAAHAAAAKAATKTAAHEAAAKAATKTAAHAAAKAAAYAAAAAAKLQLLGPTLDLSGAPALVIDFGAPVTAGPRPALDFSPAAPAAAAPAGGPDKQTPAAQRLADGIELQRRDEPAAAALLFDQGLQARGEPAVQQESAYRLGEALVSLQQPAAAQQIFERILQSGTGHPRYRKAVEWMFLMSRQLVDPLPALAVLARYRNVTFPAEYREEYNYLLAKYLFTQAADYEQQRLRDLERQRQHVDQAAGVDFAATRAVLAPPAVPAAAPIREAVRQGLELLAEVGPSSPYSPRALYLRGLFYSLGQQDQEAVNAFLQVVRRLAPKSDQPADPSLRDAAILSLARLHYGSKQFDRALFYYDRLDRDGENWLTGLFEATWAAYRRGDFDRALGYGVSLRAPFFAGAYFPEAALVEAIIYYEGCRYAEARQQLEAFTARYTAVLERLEQAAQAAPARQALLAELLQQNMQVDAADELTAALLGASLHGPAVRRLQGVVHDLQAQHDRLVTGPLRATPLAARLQAEWQLAAARQHTLLEQQLQQQLTDEGIALRGLLAQALRIKIEVAQAERDALARPQQAAVQPPVASGDAGDDQESWPFDGEYWRDELGTYEVEFSMCAPELGPDAEEKQP
jgi:hypothetical protein